MNIILTNGACAVGEVVAEEHMPAQGKVCDPIKHENAVTAADHDGLDEALNRMLESHRHPKVALQ